VSNAQAQRKRIEITLAELHPGQQQIVDEARRWNVLACGRRFGKTTLGIDLLAECALDGMPVVWFSPTYKMLTEVWREATTILKSVTSRVSAQEHRIELITGGVLDMWSLDNPDSSRGRKYARAVIDEAAMVPGLAEAWQAAIRPTLTDYRGDAFLLSTPKGINFFHECYLRGQDPDQAEWASWHMPTVANPFIDPREVEAARSELPEQVFSQEYLAEFLQNEGAVFRNIDACLKALPTTPAEHRGHRIVAGVDWAQKHDFTVISVFCSTCRREVEIDRFNKIEWAFQRARLRAAIDRWEATDTLVETNSIGSPNLEALILDRVRVRGFETTAQTKPPLIQSLALALERTEAQWLPDPVGRGELLAYESKINPLTGRVAYSAPEGGHDDTVIARALAWECHHRGGFGNMY
jgi:hypothetical protein